MSNVKYNFFKLKKETEAVVQITHRLPQNARICLEILSPFVDLGNSSCHNNLSTRLVAVHCLLDNTAQVSKQAWGRLQTDGE